MRNLLIGLTALLAIALATVDSAHAELGNAFCKLDGKPTPTRLAALVQKSLDADPSGNTPLDPVACHEKRPATPRDILRMLKVSDPDFGGTVVGQIPAYFRSLIPVVVKGRYWSACLKLGKSGWYPEANCVARRLHVHTQGVEIAWGNPKSFKPVLQGDCANPMQEAERTAGCIYFEFWARPGDTAGRIYEFGPKQIDGGACRPALRLAGKDYFESPWEELCPDRYCNGQQIAAAFHLTQQRGGSFPLTPGKYVLRLPAYVAEKDSPYRIFFCIERWKGGPLWPLPADTTYAEWAAYMRTLDVYRMAHSNSIGVRWFDYVPKNGTKVATIYYDAEDATMHDAHTVLKDQPSVLWWHWNAAWTPE